MLAKINKIQYQKSKNFFLIAGPCIIEEEDITIHEKMYRIATDRYNPFSILVLLIRRPSLFAGPHPKQIEFAAYSC